MGCYWIELYKVSYMVCVQLDILVTPSFSSSIGCSCEWKWISLHLISMKCLVFSIHILRNLIYNFWLPTHGWICGFRRYTSFAGLFPLLSSGTLPLVKVEEISQTIDTLNFTVQNSVQFAGPLATTSISTNAKFDVRSPKRVQVCLY